jgi:rubredoxin
MTKCICGYVDNGGFNEEPFIETGWVVGKNYDRIPVVVCPKCGTLKANVRN